MNPLVVFFALGPVAVYLLLLAATGLSRRPKLVTGVRDTIALAVAVSGLVLLGPWELLVPFEANVAFGPFVWLLLIALYALTVTLIALLGRPKLVIYNITVDQLRPILAEVMSRLDPAARWAGDCISLPELSVQLYLDNFAGMRTVSLVAAGGRQNSIGWRHLETALRAALAREELSRSPRGLILLVAGAICLGIIALAVAHDPQWTASSLRDLYDIIRSMFGIY